jgi:hypothetical protein
MMPTLLDLSSLTELYPDPEERRRFLRRATEILQADRLALQDALTGHAYARAGELAHRLQGTAAFLTSEPESVSAVLFPLTQAIKRNSPDDTRAAQANALRYLAELEAAIDALANPA